MTRKILYSRNYYITIINNIKILFIKNGILFGDIVKTEYGLMIYLDKNNFEWRKSEEFNDVPDKNDMIKLEKKIKKLFPNMKYKIYYGIAKAIWIEFYF